MLESLKKIIDLVQIKVNYEILESQHTLSVYLYKDDKIVRLSDHMGGTADINIISFEYDEGYCVLINRMVHYYKSARKVADFLIHYYHLSDDFSICTKTDKLSEQLTKTCGELTEYKVQLNTYKNKLNSQNMKVEELKQQLQNKAKDNVYLEELKSLRTKCSEYKEKIKELTQDCKEAADLIKTLYEPEVRTLILDNTKNKQYFLDNFPKDVQEVLKDIIKEYYGGHAQGKP